MRGLAFAVALGLATAGSASAELAVRNVQDGMLAVSAGGTPFVAYLHGNSVQIAVRRSGSWTRHRAAHVSSGSTLVAFEVKGGKAGAFRFQDALKLVRISNNLGDAKSLVTHPSTTTHQRLSEAARLDQGITQGLLRLSVGLEDPDDLIDDLSRALYASQK